MYEIQCPNCERHLIRLDQCYWHDAIPICEFCHIKYDTKQTTLGEY